MASPTNTSRIRVGGQGFTIFAYGGQALAFCQQVSHTSPSFVGQGASAIQPMDEPYPVEIIVPIAAGMGTLVLNLFDLFGDQGGSKVWDRLGATLGNNSGPGSPFGTLQDQGAGNVSTALSIGQGPFAGANDIVDIAIIQAQKNPANLNITKYVRPLPTYQQQTPTPYFDAYQGCVITDVVDGEQIEVGTLEVLKQITVNYTYVQRNGQQPRAFGVRDNPLNAASSIQ